MVLSTQGLGILGLKHYGSSLEYVCIYVNIFYWVGKSRSGLQTRSYGNYYELISQKCNIFTLTTKLMHENLTLNYEHIGRLGIIQLSPPRISLSNLVSLKEPNSLFYKFSYNA